MDQIDSVTKDNKLMPKTVSVSEAKNRLSAVMQWAVDNDDEVIVESRGEPKAVILPYEEYETFLALREGARRREALQQLEALAARLQGQNEELSEADAAALADATTRETLARLEAEGKVRFQSS